jgi:hypothetical protein
MTRGARESLANVMNERKWQESPEDVVRAVTQAVTRPCTASPLRVLLHARGDRALTADCVIPSLARPGYTLNSLLQSARILCVDAAGSIDCM